MSVQKPTLPNPVHGCDLAHHPGVSFSAGNLIPTGAIPRAGRDLARLRFEAFPKGTLVSQGGLAHLVRSRAPPGSRSREDSRSSWRDLARQTCPCTSPLERDLARQT